MIALNVPFNTVYRYVYYWPVRCLKKLLRGLTLTVNLITITTRGRKNKHGRKKCAEVSVSFPVAWRGQKYLRHVNCRHKSSPLPRRFLFGTPAPGNFGTCASPARTSECSRRFYQIIDSIVRVKMFFCRVLLLH